MSTINRLLLQWLLLALAITSAVATTLWVMETVSFSVALTIMVTAFVYVTPALSGAVLNRESAPSIAAMNIVFGTIAIGWFIATAWVGLDESSRS